MSTAVEKNHSQANSLPISPAAETSDSQTSVLIPISVQVTPTTGGGLTWQMTHEGSTINNNWIWVGANTATITFTLSLAPNFTGTLAWASTPVQWWIDGALTSTGPVNISYSVNETTNTLTFTDYNCSNTPQGNAHKFFLAVSYTPLGGTATTYYSPDPTIINKEPPTGSL